MKNGWPRLMLKKLNQMPNRIYTYFGILLICLVVLSCRTHKTVATDLSKHSVEEIALPENNIDAPKDSIHPMDNENRYRVVQPFETDKVKDLYEKAYAELEFMLSDKSKLDFKRAVFVTENAYFNDSMDYLNYLLIINEYSIFSKKLFEANSLNNYPFSDSINIKKNFAIFTLLKDTIIVNGTNFLPLEYDFNSNLNDSPWSATFVTTLLEEGKGNCHSLPYLYKILANEIGAEAYLSLAPNHLYLKHRSKQLGWYNTELTSGQFPTDAWVKASGYITIDAIRNGIYMDTLSPEQSVALCVYDLAMGYSKKTGNTLDGFILKCCDLTLKYHPQNINAIILKAETLKKNYDFYVLQNDLQNANQTFSIMKRLYVQGVQLGYREMPKEMYLAWLQSSIDEHEKYTNESVSKTLNSATK